jgi:hypothetical protein
MTRPDQTRLSGGLVIASASEAIQRGATELDCFVASLLAMTRLDY